MAFSHITFTTHCNTSITFVDDLTEPQGYVRIRDEDQHSTVYIVATEKVRDDLARIVRDWSFAEEAEARGEDICKARGDNGPLPLRCLEPAGHDGEHTFAGLHL